MIPLEAISQNTEALLIGKAILITVFGVLFGFIAKYLIRIAIDKGILRTLFKNASTYETASILNKIFTEVIQWVIIIGFLDYSLRLLGFEFLNKILGYVITNISLIIGFLLIIAIGVIVSKIVVTWIKKQEIAAKNEITLLAEILINAAFLLTAIEFIGVRATALLELYKVILYIIGIVIILLIIKPSLFEKQKKNKKNKKSLNRLF